MKRWISALLTAVLIILFLPISAWASEMLVPVGKVVGLQLRSGSVTVAAYDDDLGTLAKNAGFRVGDEIIAVDGMEVRSAEDVRKALDRCGGSLSVTVRRGARQHTIDVSPRQTSQGYRLGVYLRQGIAGIGTVTWYDPATGRFGALGHGVNDSGGCLMHMTQGSAYQAEILSIKKGKTGAPGQLKGAAAVDRVLGELYRNTPQGVFGIAGSPWPGQAVPTAAQEELHTGKAVIRSTVVGNTPRDYSVEILKIYPCDRPDGRNILLRVTDPALLDTTGGIVQGMSGSPILQDGKLVGAVTHVLVGDPTTGYGIFIDNMLDAAA